MPSALDRRLSIAPMMDYTDRFYRYFMRLISRHTLLYTEMVTTGALLHGDRERFLEFDSSEHPLALQLGGSEPSELAACARLAEQAGYDEVNLNVGCPSDRVQSGRFGACLMAEPELVADCVRAMGEAVEIPLTVKTRIGIDHQDSYEELVRFVEQVTAAGCASLTVHARKAWLQGLSPKENRDIPPLRYDLIYRLKQDFPELELCINGGIRSLEAALEHLQRVDGAMIGREAYHNPWIFSAADGLVFGDPAPAPSRRQVLEAYAPFVERQLARGIRLQTISRHILGLFQGQPGARAWRRHLSQRAHRPGAGPEVLLEAAGLVPDVPD
jgi:tRNA-dihydrouridine synthase A